MARPSLLFRGRLRRRDGGGDGGAGRTLDHLPAFLALGLPPVAANATNAVGLSFSDSVAAVAGFRRRRPSSGGPELAAAINVVGGAIGAFLMLESPAGC